MPFYRLVLPVLLFGIFACTNTSMNVVEDVSSTTKKVDSPHQGLLSTENGPQFEWPFTSGIRSIYQDIQGNFWFGSHSEGVCVFNGKSFRVFTELDGLSNNQVRSIQEYPDGSIWFETGNGVSSFRNGVIHNESASVIEDRFAQTRTWHASPSDLWFASNTKSGIYRYDGSRLQYLSFPLPTELAPDQNYLVTDVSKAGNIVWFATYAGVFSFDGAEFTLINDQSLGFTADDEKLHVRSILKDSQGRLWIGNNGIGVLLDEGNGIINFSKANRLVNATGFHQGHPSPPGTMEHVFVITEDRQGHIWFGDRDTGLWMYDGETIENFGPSDGIQNEMIWSIYECSNGELLIGTHDGDIYSYSAGTIQKLALP